LKEKIEMGVRDRSAALANRARTAPSIERLDFRSKTVLRIHGQ
jgi:hypothetical protein